MKQLLAWTIRTTLRPALSPKTPLKLQRFCSDAASAIVLKFIVVIKQKSK